MVFAAGFGFTFGMGGAAHTRFNASLKGIAGCCCSSLEGVVLDMDKYYLSLGHFIGAFSDVEQQLFLLLMLEADLSLATAQSLFSGTRAKSAMQFVGRLYESRFEEMPTRLKEAFHQLAAINTARDQLVHWAFDRDVARRTKKMVVSNNVRAHTPTSRREIEMSTELLSCLRADLLIIYAVLDVHMDYLMRDIPDENPRSAKVTAAFEKIAQFPWLYKPPQPTNPRDRSPATREGGKRPRQSFRG